jgi:MIP family channel proteins
MTRKLLAEFMGTFSLTFVGGGAIIATSGENLVVIALAHGIILAVMIAAMMHVSGAQFNPAVSIALAARGMQPWSQAFMYTIAQVVGGIVAALLLKATMVPAFDYANTHIGETLGIYSGSQGPEMISAWRVLLLEGLAAFFLMWIIMGVAIDTKNKQHAGIAALAVGGLVLAAIFCFGPLTGASMNPARSFGPALVIGEWTLQWCYWVGPIIGASIAVFVYDHVLGTTELE